MMIKFNKKIKIALILLVLVLFPVIWHYAIGPRDISESAEMSQQKIYYMGHEYSCVGWKLGPKVDVKTSVMIKPGLLSCYYLGTDKDYIIRKEWQERLVFKRQDKIQSGNVYKQPEDDAVEKAELHGYGKDSYIEFNDDKYLYLFESDFDNKNVQYEVFSNFGSIVGESLSGHFSRLKCDYDLDFLVLSRVYDGGGDIIYTKLDLTYDELMGILNYQNDSEYYNVQPGKIRNIFQLTEDESAADTDGTYEKRS